MGYMHYMIIIPIYGTQMLLNLEMGNNRYQDLP